MIDTVRLFIGFDKMENVAYHTLCHSIIKRCSFPVSITPLNRDNLKRHFWRPRGEYDSTDFSNSRFIIPHLCDFEGWAIFMDSDMLCLADIGELWAQRDPNYAVQVRKHDYEVKEDVKFLGQRQTKYSRKNWSSLMLFNNDRCRPLTKHIVNSMESGFWFHQFKWLPDEEIGSIEGNWNHLVGVNEPATNAKLVHYTLGGPWHGFQDVEYASHWLNETEEMLHGENPIDWSTQASLPG